MNACPASRARLARPCASAHPSAGAPWIGLEDEADAWRAQAAMTARAELPQVDEARLADGLAVLALVDDLVAAVIEADDVALSRACEALHQRVVGTRCLAALAVRRLARVVHSRWFAVLGRVTSRRRLQCRRVVSMHRVLGELADGSPPSA